MFFYNDKLYDSIFEYEEMWYVCNPEQAQLICDTPLLDC